MKLLYYVTPVFPEKIAHAMETDPIAATNIHYWQTRLPISKSSQPWAIHLDDLIYNDERKIFERNGLNCFRITDNTAIAKYLALPVCEFLRWWNDKEFLNLNAKKDALLDMRNTIEDNGLRFEQYEKRLIEIDAQLAMVDDWYFVNNFHIPAIAPNGHFQKTVRTVAARLAPTLEATIAPVADYLLSKFIVDHLQSIKTNLSWKTFSIAERAFNNFIKVIGDKPLQKINAQDLETFKTQRAPQVAAASVNMEVRAIKAGFNVAVDWERLERSPFSKTKQLKIQKKKKVHLTKVEFKKLMGKIPGKWMRDIVEFDVLTGLRLGELMNLKWTDFNESQKTVNIQSSEDYQVKGGKMREVPLNDRALEIIQSRNRINEWIFLSDKNKKVTNDFVSKSFKEYARAAGLSESIHFHSLRHTFGTWAAEAGIPLHTVKNIMGHSSVTVTEGYIGMDQSAMQSEISKVKAD